MFHPTVYRHQCVGNGRGGIILRYGQSRYWSQAWSKVMITSHPFSWLWHFTIQPFSILTIAGSGPEIPSSCVSHDGHTAPISIKCLLMQCRHRLCAQGVTRTGSSRNPSQILHMISDCAPFCVTARVLGKRGCITVSACPLFTKSWFLFGDEEALDMEVAWSEILLLVVLELLLGGPISFSSLLQSNTPTRFYFASSSLLVRKFNLELCALANFLTGSSSSSQSWCVAETSLFRGDSCLAGEEDVEEVDATAGSEVVEGDDGEDDGKVSDFGCLPLLGFLGLPLLFKLLINKHVKHDSPCGSHCTIFVFSIVHTGFWPPTWL